MKAEFHSRTIIPAFFSPLGKALKEKNSNLVDLSNLSIQWNRTHFEITTFLER